MYTPSRVLITGISGFVGKHLVEQCRLHYPQASIYGLYRHVVPAQNKNTHILPLAGDLLNAADMHAVLREARPDLIFHLAAQSSVPESWSRPAQTMQVNAGGFINLLEALRHEDLKPRVVIAGSSAQYGLVAPEDNPVNEDCPFRPNNPYAVSKVTQDLYAYQHFLAYKLPIIRVRPFNHFGPGQSAQFVIASFARQIAAIEAGRAEPVIQVGNLTAQRDFLPVADVVSAYLAVAAKGHEGEAYNVGSGHAYTIKEIAQLLLAQSRQPIELQTDPDRLRSVEQPGIIANTARIQAHTGWQPVCDFHDALQQTLHYWRTQV